MPIDVDGERKLLDLLPANQQTSLANIVNAVTSIWTAEVRLIENYTLHDLEHSKRVAAHAYEISQACTSSDAALTSQEAYLLLLGCYLHDIGMQCDPRRWPGVKEEADKLGANFKCTYHPGDTVALTSEQQADIRENHHWLTAAWIRWAFRHDTKILGQSLKSIPAELITELKDICSYHSKRDIANCDEKCTTSNARKRLVAAILRFSDELDIDDKRVDINTPYFFGMPAKSKLYWWMHHRTRIDWINRNCIELRVILNTEDADAYGHIISEYTNTHFIQKNIPVVTVLTRNKYPITYDPSLVPNDDLERLPDDIVTVINEIDAENRAESIKQDMLSAASTPMSSVANGALVDDELIDDLHRFTAQLHYARGYNSFQENPDKTIIDCSDALQVQPHFPEAHYLRGGAYLQLHKYELAISDFSEALKLRPEYAEAYYNRGDAYDHKGAYDLAIADYSEVLRLRPEMAVAYNNRGTAYGGKGALDLAIADYTEALRLRPEYAEAYNNRGTVYDNKGVYDQAIADYTEALRLRPEYTTVYYNRGNAYRNKREYDQAIADYTEALRLRPEYAEAYYNRGIAYGKKGVDNQAIADYTEALRLRPDMAEAYYNRGIVYGKKGAFDQAIADFTEALRLRPEMAEAYCNRGVAYDKKGEYEQAIADYTEALRLRPEYAEAYYNRGIVYGKKDAFDQAIADYTEALRLRPEYAEAYYNRGNAYDDKGAYDQAIADYTEALRLRPEYAEAFNNLAYVYVSKQDLGKALDSINKAIDLQPDNADYYDSRADVYFAKGDLSLAIADSRWVLEHSQDAKLRRLSEERLRKLGVEP